MASIIELPADRQNARVDQAVQHHGGHVDRLLIRHSPAVHHPGLQPQRRLHGVQLRTAAVDQHGLDADLVQNRHLLDQGACRHLVAEYRAARLDDEDLVLVHADVRCRALERTHGDGRVRSAHDH